MKELKKLLNYTLNYKVPTFLNIVFNALSAIFELMSLIIFMSFLKLLFGKDIEVITSPPKFSLTEKYFTDYFNFIISNYVDDGDKTKTLLFICVVILGLFFLKNLFRYLAMFYIAIFRNGVVKDLRINIYKKINNLPLSYFSEARKGDLISRMTNDVQVLEFSILNTIEVIFRDPLMVILSISIMISMNPYLTVFSLILLPLSGLVIGKLGKSLKRSSSRVQKQMGTIISSIEETLSSIKIIQAFRAKNYMNNGFEKKNQEYYHHALKMIRKKDLASPLSEFLGSFVMLALVYYGGSLVLEEKIGFTGERFIVFILIFARLLPPIKQLVSSYASIQKGAASAERIEEVLSEVNPIKNSKNPVKKSELKKNISFEQVSFSYNAEKKVLKDINLEVKKGSSVALIGSSGSGKTTLTNLLLRFFDVSQGAIKIDGINIKDFNINDLRKGIAIVTQESILFNDSVYNNIAFGDKNIDEKRAEEAAKIANAHEFINQLENTYNSFIGEGGNKLSGGQKQRLCIARAIYSNPEILILDEATSALDTNSEKLVQDAINNLMQNRTSIIIAHRLSTIKNVDEIVVLKNGKIVEKGTHKKLINQQNSYYKSYNIEN